jgi:hypothetical protein
MLWFEVGILESIVKVLVSPVARNTKLEGVSVMYGADGGSCPTLTDALSPPPVTVTEPVWLDEVVLAPQVTVTLFPDREILDTQPE